MVAETGDIPLTERAAPKKRKAVGFFARLRKRLNWVLGHYLFSSLTRRILFLNMAALVVLVVGILY
ncbi:MAG: sensor N-terminal transmembrane domain-containing protein, partial [Rhizobiales bacterium]|nr:sensor N-terminal transmembrane domain-containing protein [Hyphomicrobiales bacterium]